MHLKVIDFQDVQQDLDTGAPTNFNTNFHKEEEAPGLLLPSHAPYSYDRWLPLILETRGLPATAVQVLSLTRSQVRLLKETAGASIHTRQLNRAYAADLQEDVYPAFSQLEFPSEGLFMRLAALSPKDGTQKVPGQMSLHSVGDIVLRLSTSTRASNTFSNFLNTDAESLQVFFLPFDARMRTDREYRVFCKPKSLRITAVSQYRWHKPWLFARKDPDKRDIIAQHIMTQIEQVHAKIINDLHEKGSDENDDLLRTQGFSFDVLYDEDTGKCELIELNTFGVRSACGSCLFQWIKDRALLYGEGSEVEFRVAV